MSENDLIRSQLNTNIEISYNIYQNIEGWDEAVDVLLLADVADHLVDIEKH